MGNADEAELSYPVSTDETTTPHAIFDGSRLSSLICLILVCPVPEKNVKAVDYYF